MLSDIHWILFFVNWPHDVGFIDVIEQSKGRILMTILSTSFKRHRHEFFVFFFENVLWHNQNSLQKIIRIAYYGLTM